MSLKTHSVNYNKTKIINVEDLDNSWKEQPDQPKTTINESLSYNPYSITNLQQYNPIYSLFFDLTPNNYNSISLNHKYFIKNLKEVVEFSTKKVIKKPVFVKFSPLLDPLRYMIGKYNNDISNNHNIVFPTPSFTTTTEKDINDTLPSPIIHPKIASVTNASYVDCFFYYLSSILLNHYNFQNGIDFYGSFLGIQKQFKINIEDDLEYLNDSTFFKKNIDKLFYITNFNKNEFGEEGGGGEKLSRNKRTKINILKEEPLTNNNILLDEIMEISTLPSSSLHESPISSISSLIINEETIFDLKFDSDNEKELNIKDREKSEGSESEESERSEGSTDDETNTDDETSEESTENPETHSNESDTEYEDTDDDETDDEDDNPEDETHAYINDFPVQMICMEKCDGTMDDLFSNNEIDETTGISAMFQIIMILLTYQSAFDFTHNDLHTNNITFVNTSKKHLYYKYNNIIYKIPTFGRIFKIIDFGRAIYKYQGKLFCSDSFSPQGDATTQYNCEPFFNEKKPRVLPNPSFDLCRLGCSVYDFIIDNDNMKKKDFDDFQKIINEWCTDDNGKNILYKKGEEKYPGFKLYKVIARNVTKHTPQNQLTKPIFQQFIVNHPLSPNKLKDVFVIE
jgi:hypothetical protein